MEIRAVADDAGKLSRDVTVAGYFEDFVPVSTSDILNRFSLQGALQLYSFSGKLRETATVPVGNELGLLIVVGLGPRASFDCEALRSAYSLAVTKAAALRKDSVLLLAPGVLGTDREALELAFTARSAAYSFSRFKSQSRKELSVVSISPGGSEGSVSKGDIIGKGVNFGRDLANMPATGGTPSFFVNQAKESPGLKVEVLERDDFIKLGMGGLEAVSRGSSEPAKLLIVSYKNSDTAPVVFVGKGITFDSGGISIKPSENLANLKFDKSGASAVLGAMKAISELGLKVNAVGLLPLTENMPDGNSYKPGDVVKHYNGVTSEIISTDAEGRLVLADALSYGIERFHPRAVVDIATLTGAKNIALGQNFGAVMTNNSELLAKVMAAAGSSWEQLWQLPLAEEFREQIKGEVADIKNTGGRPAGSETAGAFLSYFVGDTPWVHLDINGRTATANKDKRCYLPEGASGFGVRLIVELADDLADDNTLL